MTLTYTPQGKTPRYAVIVHDHDLVAPEFPTLKEAQEFARRTARDRAPIYVSVVRIVSGYITPTMPPHMTSSTGTTNE